MAFEGQEAALSAPDVAGGVNEGLGHIIQQWGEALVGSSIYVTLAAIPGALVVMGIRAMRRGGQSATA